MILHTEQFYRKVYLQESVALAGKNNKMSSYKSMFLVILFSIGNHFE